MSDGAHVDLILQGKLVFKSHTTVESIGKEFLHDKVEENIRYLEKCITEHGVTGCIFLREFIGDAPDGKVADILRMGCYYIFVEQTLKFIKVILTPLKSF